MEVTRASTSGDSAVKGFQITFFTQQNRRHGNKPLHQWLVDVSQTLGIVGATAARGVEGYGRSGKFHSAHFFDFTDQPIEVTMAMTEKQAATLLARLEQEHANVFYVKTPVEYGAVGSPAGTHPLVLACVASGDG
jgi:PII-like signaling protein